MWVQQMLAEQNRTGELRLSGLVLKNQTGSIFQTSLIFQNQTIPGQRSIGLPFLQPPITSPLIVLLAHFHFFPPLAGGMDGEAEYGVTI